MFGVPIEGAKKYLLWQWSGLQELFHPIVDIENGASYYCLPQKPRRICCWHMSNRKKGLEAKSQWLVHQDLIEYYEGRTIGPMHILNYRKGNGVLYPRSVYTMHLVVIFYSQVRIYIINVRKLFYFYVVRQSKVFTCISNRTHCHFVRYFIPKWAFTPWTERIVARFIIEESCLKIKEIEWIVIQDVELRTCGSSRYSSRYISWSLIYFWLKSEQL